jgi:cytochrome c biogenesis protein CcmG/thiol:disulfide interchange protein DsbE
VVCPECDTALGAVVRFCHHCGWDRKLAAAGKASSTASERPAWKRLTMASTLLGAIGLMLWLLLMPRNSSDAALLVGQPAPGFTLESITGEQVSLADLKGRPIILNFWATWCPPCREEMPYLQDVHDRYQDQGLQVIGVNVGESNVAVRSFLSSVGATFPTLLDKDENVQTAYKIIPLPTTFFIDRHGVLSAIYPYQLRREQVELETLRILTVR